MERPRIEFYRDAAGEWRWRYRSRNGNVLASSSEGYRNFGDCLNGACIVTGYTQYRMEKTTATAGGKRTVGTMWNTLSEARVDMVVDQ